MEKNVFTFFCTNHLLIFTIYTQYRIKVFFILLFPILQGYPRMNQIIK